MIMKAKYALFTTVLMGILALSVFGQIASNEKTKPIPKKNDVSTMMDKPVYESAPKKNDVSAIMGKPVYESTVDSLRTKVWIITQKKNTEMMGTARGKMMSKTKVEKINMDNETKKIVMVGTHCIILDVSNISNGKVVADTSAKVEIVSPTKILSSVNFVPMMSYFGGGATLNERGEYLFTINLNVGTGYKTSQFKYRVK